MVLQINFIKLLYKRYFTYTHTHTYIYINWYNWRIWHHPYGRKWRRTKVKEESEKVGLKLNIQKTKIMASGPVTSWQIDRETMETVTDFILGGSKITANGNCSHEIERRLLLGRKALTNLDSILKSRDITLPTKVSQSYGFSSSHVCMWKLDY